MQDEINDILLIEESKEVKPLTEKIRIIRRTAVLISLTRAIIDTHNSKWRAVIRMDIINILRMEAILSWVVRHCADKPKLAFGEMIIKARTK